MPGIADLLSRLRPAGAPGSAVRERLRVDHAAELAAELGPVLDMLAAADARSAAVVAAADREAARIERTAAASVSARRRPAEADVRALAAQAVRLVTSMPPGAAQPGGAQR